MLASNREEKNHSPWRRRWIEISEKISLIFLALCAWGTAYVLFGEVVGIDSVLFKLCLMFIVAKIGGWLLSLVKVPQLVGMLIVGLIIRNLGIIEVSGPYLRLLDILRKLALVNILLPAGLGLDPINLKRMFKSIINLSITPSVVEVIVLAVLARYTMDLPWSWSFLTGIVATAVSPSVVIPCLFQLQEQGYGTDKGIHTLLIAATTISDIIAIAAFKVNVGIIFSTSVPYMQVLNVLIAIGMGVGTGVLLGIFARFVPDRDNPNVITLRTLFIGIGSVFTSLGADYLGYSIAGTLACIISAFVASAGWRKFWGDAYNPVKQNFSLLWRFMEPVSFALIGYEINLSVLTGEVVLWCTLAVLIALLARAITTVLIFYKTKLNFKEMFFVGYAWIPKATVQATIGPVALDLARQLGNKEHETNALVPLIVAVLSIILTAPIGTILILTLGPRMLHRTLPTKDDRENQSDEGFE